MDLDRVCDPRLPHFQTLHELHSDHKLSSQFCAVLSLHWRDSRIGGQAFPPFDDLVVIDLDRDCDPCR